MLMVLLSAPLCLLCLYLTFLCYRRGLMKQTLVLGAFAMMFLLFTLGMIGASFYTWEALKVEAATTETQLNSSTAQPHAGLAISAC